MRYTWNVFPRRVGVMQRLRWFFNLEAGNGEIVLQSEAYIRQADALHTIDQIRKYAPIAGVVVKPDA